MTSAPPVVSRKRPRRARRGLLTLAAGLGALLAAAGLAGCNAAPDYAAKVNGTVISKSTLNNELEDIAKNTTYVTMYQQGTAPGQAPDSNGQPVPARILGASPGTFDGTFVASRLTNDILYELVREELVRRHLSITTADLTAAQKNEVSGYIPSGQTTGDSLFTKFPIRFQTEQVNDVAGQMVLERALGAPNLTQALIQSYFDQHKSDFPPSQLCLSVIVAADQATATTLKQQLDHGADFATLAKQKSQDQATAAKGGDAGCLPSSQLPANITTALAPLAINQVSAPIDNGGNGVLLIKVYKRVAATVNDVANQISATLLAPSQQAFGNLIQSLAEKAHITINPRYGTFQSKPTAQNATVGVIPPALSTVTTATDNSTGSSGAGSSGATGTN